MASLLTFWFYVCVCILGFNIPVVSGDHECQYKSYYDSYYCYYEYNKAATIVGIVIGSLIGGVLFISVAVCLCCQLCKKSTQGTVVHQHPTTTQTTFPQPLSTQHFVVGTYPTHHSPSQLPPLHHPTYNQLYGNIGTNGPSAPTYPVPDHPPPPYSSMKDGPNSH